MNRSSWGDYSYPTKGECTACHEYTDRLYVCKDCELPFDYQCILSICNRLTAEEEYQCVQCHRKYNATHASDDLAERSLDDEETHESSTVKGSSSSSDSSTIVAKPTTPTPPDENNELPAVNHESPTTQAKQPWNISTRKSPPKTRNSTKQAKEPPSNTDAYTRVQQRLNPPRTAENIDPSGDPITDRTESDGLIRIAYQNVHGIRMTNCIIPTELETLEAHGINIMGMSETNCPWTPEAQSEFNFMMNQCLQSSRTIYSSSPPTSNSRYQPGGNLLTINGHTTGRITSNGSDPWG